MTFWFAWAFFYRRLGARRACAGRPKLASTAKSDAGRRFTSGQLAPVTLVNAGPRGAGPSPRPAAAWLMPRSVDDEDRPSAWAPSKAGKPRRLTLVVGFVPRPALDRFQAATG